MHADTHMHTDMHARTHTHTLIGWKQTSVHKNKEQINLELLILGD